VQRKQKNQERTNERESGELKDFSLQGWRSERPRWPATVPMDDRVPVGG
jgi:hypothetical protein